MNRNFHVVYPVVGNGDREVKQDDIKADQFAIEQGTLIFKTNNKLVASYRDWYNVKEIQTSEVT
jgi:hypothetical protein